MKYKVKTKELFLLHGQHINAGRELILTSEEFNKVRDAVDVIETIMDKPIIVKKVVKVIPVIVTSKEVEYTIKEEDTGKKVTRFWMKGNKIKFKSIGSGNKEASKIIRRYQMKRSENLESLIEELKKKGYDI